MGVLTGQVWKIVQVRLPPGVSPQEQWLVEPLQEEDEVEVQMAGVKPSQNGGRRFAVYIYNSTAEKSQIPPYVPVERAM